MPGTLYLVATPIGNLQDISARALRVLTEVDLVACEDTRHTGKLLAHFGIKQKLKSYHEHNESVRAVELGEILLDDKDIAVVSDAGTPGVCDPGREIVQRAIEIGAQIVPIPGAAAFVNAVVASGLPTDSIFFGGFLPSKKGDRRKRLADVSQIPATLVFYETPHRIAKSLADCSDILGNRAAAVVRELTKLHEEIIRGNLSDLAEIFSHEKVKGEIVLVLDRQAKSEPQIPNTELISERVTQLESAGIDHKNALKQAAKEFGMSKSEAYRMLHIDA